MSTLWLKFLPEIAAALFTAALGLILHTGAMDHEKLNQQHALSDQASRITATLNAACQKDKAITTEVSHDYETKISALNTQLAHLKRLRGPSCIPILTDAPASNPARPDDAAQSRQHARPNGQGLNPEWLYDFAAEAEHYRLQLISCQNFLTQTWSANKQ